MKNIVKEISKNGLTARIFIDELPENPRTSFDNFGTMVCFHRRYTLGDQTEYKSHNYDSLDELAKDIKATEKDVVMLPVYLLDHSGISVSTTPFGCPWDSGQIGFIFVSKEKIRQEYNVKKVTKKLLKTVQELLSSEVNTYNQYLTGDVYRYEISDSNGNETDSCCGYFGIEHIEQDVNSMLTVTA